MIEDCKLARLPKPIYFYDMSGFFVEFRKDNYNEQYLSELGLNERQIKAILFVRKKGNITNSIYQKINVVRRTTAAVDLQELVSNGILIQVGAKGRGIKYTFK
jgi:ATP-dependent DNA helicase RecG